VVAGLLLLFAADAEVLLNAVRTLSLYDWTRGKNVGDALAAVRGRNGLLR
jgi:hypothetical protein